MALPQLQEAFLSMRPRIVRHAGIYFRDVRCHQRRDDCIAEVVGLCWMWFCRLARRGKDARRFISTLATFAARAVRGGRRVCGQLRSKDALSEWAQRRQEFRVESLPFSTRVPYQDLYATVDGQRRIDVLEECLHDNTVSPVPDQVAFRLDFPLWLGARSGRDRRIIADMARQERTSDLARKYRLSPGRISQLRQAYETDWKCFWDATPNGRRERVGTRRAGVAGRTPSQILLTTWPAANDLLR
jgi:hypothetical protein